MICKNPIFITTAKYYINSKQSQYLSIYNVKIMKSIYSPIKSKLKSSNNNKKMI